MSELSQDEREYSEILRYYDKKFGTRLLEFALDLTALIDHGFYLVRRHAVENRNYFFLKSIEELKEIEVEASLHLKDLSLHPMRELDLNGMKTRLKSLLVVVQWAFETRLLMGQPSGTDALFIVNGVLSIIKDVVGILSLLDSRSRLGFAGQIDRLNALEEGDKKRFLIQRTEHLTLSELVQVDRRSRTIRDDQYV